MLKISKYTEKMKYKLKFEIYHKSFDLRYPSCRRRNNIGQNLARSGFRIHA